MRQVAATRPWGDGNDARHYPVRMYQAAPLHSLLIEPLDELTAVFHRASGVTHLLASPAPELLRALQEPATVDGLLARLREEYEIKDGDRAALLARLDELAAAGLVRAA